MIDTDRVKWDDDDYYKLFVSIDGSDYMSLIELTEAFIELKDILKVYEEDLKESREF